MGVFIPRFLGAIAYLLALSVVGAVGFVVIEGWSWQEALYITVITLTAVGFQEVQPLSWREFVFNPPADTRLDIGDEIIVLGQPDQVALLRSFARA